MTKGVAEVGKNGEKREYSKYSFDYGGKIIHFSPDLGWSSNTGAHAWEIDVQAWNKIEGMSEKIKDEFISKMANNPHNKQVIINLTEKMIANNFKLTSVPISKPLTWLTPELYKKVKAENIEIQSPIIVFEETQVKHSLSGRKVEKQRLNKEQFKNIYDYIQKPDEIFIDLEDLALIFVKFLPEKEIIDGRDCIKIPIKINSRDEKRPVNYMSTSGRINYHKTFGGTQKRYKKVE